MRAGSPLLSKLSPLLGGKKKNGRSKTRKSRVIVILYLHIALCVSDVHMLIRGEERRKKEGRKKQLSEVIQTTKQSNTAHPRPSLFQRKMSCLGWDLNPRHSTL